MLDGREQKKNKQNSHQVQKKRQMSNVYSKHIPVNCSGSIISNIRGKFKIST